MPIIQSAIKKMRKDQKRTKQNKIFISRLKDTINKAEKTKETKVYREAISLIDKAVKKKIMKKNTGTRRKSKLTKEIRHKGT
jgi:small subunit ribosomal protein S20